MKRSHFEEEEEELEEDMEVIDDQPSSSTSSSLVVNNLPWIEKYRPKSLSELIAHEDIINICK